MSALTLYTPAEWNRLSPSPPPSTFRFLAQGDSWFSIGSLNPSTTNLLMPMKFNFDACAVNFAQPGAQAAEMVDVAPSSKWVYNPGFAALLHGNLRTSWDAILMSAGGNDLICAVMTPPKDDDGLPVPREKRLLLLAGEWGPQKDVSRYFSEEGWRTFETYLLAIFDVLLSMRDHPKSKSRGKPLFLHSYCYVQPRNAGVRLVPAGPWLGGPWLYKAVNLYKIPNDNGEWLALTKYMMNRLLDLLKRVAKAYANVHVVDFIAKLKPADEKSEGVSGDWVNEIHPTENGYRILGKIYSSEIQRVLKEVSMAAPAALNADSPRHTSPRRSRKPHASREHPEGAEVAFTP